jgi:hypothetical protein
MKYLYSFLLLCLVALSCSRCKEECDDPTNPECPNYVAPTPEDPCEGALEVTADFIIEERISAASPQEWIPTDTTFKGKTVRFRSTLENADEYKWYVGNEILYGQAVSRFFDDVWAGSNIPITLVVQKTPNNVCFPNDDGRDSITKVFHVSQYPIIPGPNAADRTIEHGGLQGTYRLKRQDLPDSIDVNISFCDNWFGPYIIFENLDGQGTVCHCDTINNPPGPLIYKWGYRYAAFESAASVEFCRSVSGSFYKPMNGLAEVEIVSRTAPFSGGPVSEAYYSYKGRKIR